jgi:hypothetical protein
MVIVIVVVLVAVFLAARGRGDGLSAERNDYAPLDLGPVTATDVVLLRPPTGMWGYDMAATDDALEQIAESIRERDVRIVALEQLVTDLSRDQDPAMPLASPYTGARHRRAATDPAGAYETGAYETGAYETGAYETGAYETGGYEAGTYQAGPEPASTGPNPAVADPAVADPVVPEPADAEPADTGPAGPDRPGPGLPRPPWEIAETPWESTNTETARLPFDPGLDPGRPGGEAAGPPPGRSHD